MKMKITVLILVSVMLAAGASAELCDPVALLTLTRIGLIKGLQLTPAAHQLCAALTKELAAA